MTIKPDVLIINSPLFRDTNPLYDEDSLPPIGLGLIATALARAGVSVALIDTVADRIALAELTGQILKLRPLVVATNIFTTNYDLVREFLESIADASPHVIVGGLSTRTLYEKIFTWAYPASTMALFFSTEEGSGMGPAGRWEIRGYVMDRSNARGVGGPSLTRIIADIEVARPETRIDIICFSMGCYVLQKALELNGGTIPKNVDTLIFLAADIDQDALPGIVTPSRPGQRVAVHFSREDGVLSALSRIMNMGKTRLGAIGPPSPVPAHVSAFDQTAALDVAGKGGKTPVHSRYLDTRFPVVENVIGFLTRKP